ncbi:putative membrane protein insertion efficiency factor [Buchnera aphidicola (Nipponaphis monzeni)]|uniref:Putative membrane protein insertion efficiency factor n=1 Tax=Buchnera aphidicola (Nipponaphis monzeni) TaxID=2495405 RepID=A0A455T9N5_9GAMM|nr:membrane protein insertion efficiency factor YidD [Buchnera aphidicola]BBI01032.1 putative membrane protein insertion efficiency factor [Buchnera aphidicola (Nipponaphis monzeni)]
MVTLLSNITKTLILCIKIYQKYISILIQPHCRYYPSCSQYAIQMLNNVNLFKSIWLIFKRILKCQPLYTGGIDNPFKKH